MSVDRIRTDVLEIPFEQGGAPDGIPILLLYGWPGDGRQSYLPSGKNA